MTWDLNQLEALLSDNQDLVVTQEQDCLLVANSDGIDAWIAISGEQIIIETLLFAKSEIKSTAALNEEILKTHMLFPLTTVGISSVGGDDYYTAFGSLSSQSKAQSIIIELNTLFQNVEAFIDAYQIHLQ
ncbi:YjfI family protein [Paraglaciecola sp.]|uniref:YjfI family protein n=1 Tax=Paraglaciecola sp. TaxID=1920173 RepID=UPI0030F3A9B3